MLAPFGGLASAQIVDRVLRTLDHFANFGQPVLCGIHPLGRKARNKIQIDDAEQDGLKDRGVVFVERTVDED
jgi:hypothetical protein